MSIQYPKEIQDQQAKVNRELKKLAKMRTDHLIASGQLPNSHTSNPPASSGASNIDASPLPRQSEIKSSK